MINDEDMATSRRVLTQRLYKYSRHELPYRATMEYTDDELRRALMAILFPILGADGLYAARKLLSLPKEEPLRNTYDADN